MNGRTHYVYTFWRGNVPLYVGCTVNLRQRMREHGRNGMQAGATWVAWAEFPNREAGLAAERERISKLMPRGNIRYNPGRSLARHAVAEHEAWLEWEAEFEAQEAKYARAAA